MTLSAAGKDAGSHYDISRILRPTERVSVTIPCRVRTDGLEFHQAQAGVVLSRASQHEGAAMMVIVPSTASSDTRITHLIPITPAFQHSLNQTPPSPSTSFFHQSSRPHITYALSNGDDKVELRISAAQTVKVQALIAELRRLVELSRSFRNSTTASHSWTRFYPVQPPSFSDLSDDEVTSPAAESSTSSGLTASSSTMSIQTLQTPMTALTIPSSELSAGEEDQFPNPYAEGFSRSSFLRKRLFARQDQWSSTTPISIRLGTYNVNDKLPPPGTNELKPMVGDGEEDLLVFGFQEVDLRSQALLYSQGNVRAQEWEAAILRGLKEKAGEYERIALTQYVGVVTMVFAKKSIRDAISRVETGERGIGLLGFGGNKAGVCARLKVHDSTLCFVNSHLAAFATALERRRADYQVLLKTLTFQRPAEDTQPAFEEFHSDARDKLISIEDSHVLFWMGDLNYRVDVEDDILRAWVDEKRWKPILEKDQLASDIANGKSFVGFQEAAIDFPPTYKYVHGSSTLDTKRSPAYTDRILYSLPGPSKVYSRPAQVNCKSYTAHEIFWSDHRPVTAVYSVDVRIADDLKRREAYFTVERELDKLEEVYRPSLEIEGTSMEFGEIRLGKAVTKVVQLRNKGRVPVMYHFKAPSPDRPICKAPIWPFPSMGRIEPGQESSLRLTMHVENSAARNLTVGEEDLNDVLVLQVAGGKDTFITVQATFLPTILTLPLTYLAALPEPIRSTPLSRRKELASPVADPLEDKKRGTKSVKEMWRLLEYLMTSGTEMSQLWTQQVETEEVYEMIERLDTGSEIPTGLTVVVARTILFLLGELPCPVIGDRGQDCEQAVDRDEAFAALEGLEQINTNVLIGLMSVVRLCAGIAPSPRPTPEIKHVEKMPDPTEETDELDDLVVHQAAPEPLVTPEPEPAKEEERAPRTVDDETVNELVRATFGGPGGLVEGRRRFVRLMLEG